jgi:hypothetical protein
MVPDNAGGWLIPFIQYTLLGLLMLALWLGCVLFSAIGTILFWRAAILTRYGVRVEARVVGTHVDPNDSECTQYRIVEFTDCQGTTHSSQLAISSSHDPPVGRPMLVVYNPSDPGEVSGTTFAQLWMAPLACCVLGWAGVLIGVGVVCGVIPTE